MKEISKIIIAFAFFLLSGNTNTVLADLTTENFATSVNTCPRWDNTNNFFEPPDSKYATIINKIPTCTFNGFSPFNIPEGSKINALIVRIYNSLSGNSGISSMAPAHNQKQLCIPPPFFPGVIHNGAHEYIVILPKHKAWGFITL